VLYLVLEGTVRVERPGRVMLLGPGDVVGEIEVLDPGGRLADVVAEGAVRAVAVGREAVRVALEAEPAAAWALLGLLASRFRETA
jgi:CRP-like cAMP-binding protein